jgi:hypothetical protein
MKITDFNKIDKFPHCSYRVDVGWDYLEKHIEFCEESNLDLNPDFQRAHVWNTDQQISYCEYILRNGSSGKELYFNCTGWNTDMRGPYVIVDGKQRLHAVRLFMGGHIPVFGSYIGEYRDSPNMLVARFSWNVASLETREEVLRWYLNFNAGGTVHTEDELQKVRDMLKNPLAKTN